MKIRDLKALIAELDDDVPVFVVMPESDELVEPDLVEAAGRDVLEYVVGRPLDDESLEHALLIVVGN